MTLSFSKYTIQPLQLKDSNDKPFSNIPQISEKCQIIDSRILKDFKDQTFGGYKLSQASQALEKAILEDKIEPALHWCLQLFLSGIINPLWSKLFSLACKNINIYNPKLPEFIYNKTQQWQQLTDNGKFNKDNILLLRNHPGVRLLLAEFTTILTLSRKRKLNQLPKIKKEEFIIDNFRAKLEAKDNKLIENIITDGDPSEIKIAINEMALHIYSGNSTKAFYWLNWIIEWEKINTKKYGKYECGMRGIEGVDGKYFRDVVWLIWKVINHISALKFSLINTDFKNQIHCLYLLYINKFTPATRAKKLPLIIWSILYMTEIIDTALPLVDRPAILFQSILGFDKIIASLKSQEVHSIVNSELMNVVVENNYLLPENHKELEAGKLLGMKVREEAEREILVKQKKTNIASIEKLNEIYKLDRMMYA